MRTSAAITSASGARFGRMVTAKAAAHPAADAAPSPGRRLITQASAQNAAAGTSLKGMMAWPITTGVAPMSSAASTPAHAVDMERPSANAHNTSTPASSGETTSAVRREPVSFQAAAISSG
jgi:hypothetical protein